jgi:hypothetical protein
MISCRLVAVSLALGLSLSVAPQISRAAEDHLAEAISHTKEAIDQGKEGNAQALVTHDEQALKHANMAEAENKNPHTEQGISHLKESIDHGKQGHPDVATKHAEEALKHLEQAKQ